MEPFRFLLIKFLCEKKLNDCLFVVGGQGGMTKKPLSF